MLRAAAVLGIVSDQSKQQKKALACEAKVTLGVEEIPVNTLIDCGAEKSFIS
jgi:hypothetical protein